MAKGRHLLCAGGVPGPARSSFIIACYGSGRLIAAAGYSAIVDYLFRFHFANATLMPDIVMLGAVTLFDTGGAGILPSRRSPAGPNVTTR